MSVKNDKSLISGMLRDLKHYGQLYIKSEITAQELKAADKNVTTEYNKEERYYIAYYKRGG